ncbi:11155_t:CDS:2 [Paraglomus brasilianum]|uniref:11155_t:CDS:1 n=1 Tax=Paraglomus brasilianum TaxID=144538 RepID=A0A9N8Z0Q6_9GLOM|nr:11155_t:CDS:2 [Paraglomus brasilianum]
MSIIGFDDRLEHQVNRLFDDFVRDLGVTRRGETTRRPNNDRQKWAPLVDVHERDKDYIVTAELPGVKKDQINLDVRENTLVISGETKKDQQYNEGNTHIRERRWGSFSRSISLPNNVKSAEISAKFNDGVLEVTLPKIEAVQPKKITID